MRRAGAWLLLPALAFTPSCGFDSQVLSAATAPVGTADVVAAGREFTCALVDGRGWCFGANVDGALGTGDAQTHLAPTPLDAPVGFDTLAAGQNHTCGLEHGTGAIWCWGYNANGQLGLGDLVARAVPTRLPAPAAALALAAGYNHTCAIAVDHSLWCWGQNTEGQLGQNDVEGAPDATLPVPVGTNADWLAVAGGDGHTCGVRAPGTMWCWGRNTDAETGGSPDLIQTRTPGQTGTFADWTGVDVGQLSSCGVRSDHSLWCWGDNSFGQLAATPATPPVPVPQQIGTDTDWTQISIDAFSACAVKTDGSLWCWGRNAEGQLGVGDIDDRYVPTQVGSLATWLSTSVGRFHACAIHTDGVVECAGENSNGQLGLGDTNRRNVPTPVSLTP